MKGIWRVVRAITRINEGTGEQDSSPSVCKSVHLTRSNRVGGENPGEKPEQSGVARPGQRLSFEQAETQAREVLRSRGFSDAQIEIELRRVKREQLD